MFGLSSSSKWRLFAGTKAIGKAAGGVPSPPHRSSRRWFCRGPSQQRACCCGEEGQAPLALRLPDPTTGFYTCSSITVTPPASVQQAVLGS